MERVCAAALTAAGNLVGSILSFIIEFSRTTSGVSTP
jgi:hypothetical protein